MKQPDIQRRIKQGIRIPKFVFMLLIVFLLTTLTVFNTGHREYNFQNSTQAQEVRENPGDGISALRITAYPFILAIKNLIIDKEK